MKNLLGKFGHKLNSAVYKKDIISFTKHFYQKIRAERFFEKYFFRLGPVKDRLGQVCLWLGSWRRWSSRRSRPCTPSPPTAVEPAAEQGNKTSFNVLFNLCKNFPGCKNRKSANFCQKIRKNPSAVNLWNI